MLSRNFCQNNVRVIFFWSPHCEFELLKIEIIFFRQITGQTASYGFIHFDSDAAALMAMHKLNGKIIPHSQPVSKKLIHSVEI